MPLHSIQDKALFMFDKNIKWDHWTLSKSKFMRYFCIWSQCVKSPNDLAPSHTRSYMTRHTSTLEHILVDSHVDRCTLAQTCVQTSRWWMQMCMTKHDPILKEKTRSNRKTTDPSERMERQLTDQVLHNMGQTRSPQNTLPLLNIYLYSCKIIKKIHITVKDLSDQ